MGQGAVHISQGQGHIGYHGFVWKAEILRKLHGYRFRDGVGPCKKSNVKAGPGHSGQRCDDGVDKNQSKQGHV